ncbi:MAG: futalosine hydrolase [Desulfohalobiaceae bacterium]|nr:futalosine hydrolase [Desulfohalobiaceae bacterium]
MNLRRLAIVTATGKELRAAVDGAPRISSPEPVAWRWRGLDLFLVTSGTGPVNAAWGLGRLLEHRQELLGVLNIGIAGSFDTEALPLLSTVVVREEIWPEFGLRTAGGVDPAGLKYGQGTLEGQEVRDRVGLSPGLALARLGVRRPLPWPEGRSLTVAGATGDAELAREHRRRYSPDLENMEGFALAWPCLKYGVPFAEVRCVSNPVGSRLSRDWDIQGALGQLNSVMMTLVESMG